MMASMVSRRSDAADRRQIKEESMTNIRHFLLFLLFFLSVLMLPLGGGCSTLPKVSGVIDDARTQEPPQILSATGRLSPEKSKALMERLKRSVAPTDMLQRYSAVIESVSGSPLTNGNKVTLLIDSMTAL